MFHLHKFEYSQHNLVCCIWQEVARSYFKALGTLALERRGQPSDRTKTPEEIAQEEREQLEHLEVSHLVMTYECACIHSCSCLLYVGAFYCC